MLPDPCTLVTQAEAKAVTGFPTLPRSSPVEYPPLGTMQLCGFIAARSLDPNDLGAFALVSVGVIDLGDEAASRFNEYRDMAGGTVSEPSAGLGDDNMVLAADDHNAILSIRHDHILLQVTVVGTPGALAHATTLAQTALTRL